MPDVTAFDIYQATIFLYENGDDDPYLLDTIMLAKDMTYKSD